ncbi:VOC family protein [Magnetococcales bacterium HHB-1]
MIHYTGVHHLAFTTNDINKTIHFWRDLLGMRLLHSHGRPGYRQYYFEINRTGLIAFFEWPEVEPAPCRRHGDPFKGMKVFDHVSIGVEDDSDLILIAEKMIAAERPMTDIIDHGFFRSIYSYDPNGIPLEFSCNVAEFNIHEQPLLADKEPPEATLEGSEPILSRWPKEEPGPEEEWQPIPGEGYDLFHPS